LVPEDRSGAQICIRFNRNVPNKHVTAVLATEQIPPAAPNNKLDVITEFDTVELAKNLYVCVNDG
jgi:hypothetical protein